MNIAAFLLGGPHSCTMKAAQQYQLWPEGMQMMPMELE